MAQFCKLENVKYYYYCEISCGFTERLHLGYDPFKFLQKSIAYKDVPI